MLPVILSHYQTELFPRNPKSPVSITFSPDLGLTQIEIRDLLAYIATLR